MATYSRMLPELGRNQGMGNINARGMLPALGNNGGMSSTTGRAPPVQRIRFGTPTGKTNNFDAALRESQKMQVAQAPVLPSLPPSAPPSARAITFGATAPRQATDQAIRPSVQPGRGMPTPQPSPQTNVDPRLPANTRYTPQPKPIANPGWGEPGYKDYIAQLPQLGQQTPSGTFIDPATGRMLRPPTTPAELAQAEMEARNAALTGQARSLEANINRGTEELTESENEARRQGTASAAAAGVTNAADMQGGMQALGSKYAGMRANLARDLRAQQLEKQRAEDSSMFGRMFNYGEAARAAEEAGARSTARGGGGGGGGGGNGRDNVFGGGFDAVWAIAGERPTIMSRGSRAPGKDGPSSSARDLEQDVINRSRQLQGPQNFMNLSNMMTRRMGGLG